MGSGIPTSPQNPQPNNRKRRGQPLHEPAQLPITEFAHKAAVIRDALVVTVIALLYVTAKRGSSALFDRGHDATLRGGRRRAITSTKGFTVAAEYVRHFEPEPGHRFESQKGFGGVASGSVGTGRGNRSSGLEVAQTLIGGDSKISSRGAQTSMTKQQLNGPHIGSRFEQMDSKGVSKRMGSNRFGKCRQTMCFLARILNRGRGDRLPRKASREQPFLRMRRAPVAAQDV